MEPIDAVQALLTPEGRADPYPYYAAILDRAPAFSVDGWTVLSGYDACAQALRDPGLLSEDAEYLDRGNLDWRTSAALTALSASMLFTNSPDHERMRRLASRVFTARRIEDLRPAVERLTTALLDRMTELGAGGAPVDVMAEFAYLLPITVICELLGIPEGDRTWFRGPSADLAFALEPVTSLASLAAADEAAVVLRRYFTDLIAERRKEPTEDLVSALVRVHDEDRTALTEDELLANLILLLIAGFETTTNLLGNGLRLLLDRPEHAARLRDEPGTARAYVEEILRHDSPVQLTSRWSRTDVELVGVRVAAGNEILLLLGAANRDPRRFADPDRFDPDRPDNQPLSFGGGPHFCLGAALARMEGQVALPMMLTRFPGLRLAAEPTRRDRLTLRGYEHLPVRLS